MPMTAEFYRQRRRKLSESMGHGSVALVPAASEKMRSNDVEYRFRQSSDFDYLCGFPEPDALCLLLPGSADSEFVLFVRPRDQERETWTGRRSGVEGAVASYGASAAFPLEELDDRVPELIKDCEAVYYSIDGAGDYNGRILGWIESLQTNRQRSGRAPSILHDLRPSIHEMRLIKSAEEIERMREAAAISCLAHEEAMRSVRPGEREYEVEARLEYAFRRRGASGPAYPSIVAGGANATILHYTENCCELEEDALLLIDAGAELECYCGDVTRTFPVAERFDGRQRAVYEIVLAAQKSAVESVRPEVTFDSVHDVALRVLVEGLVDLGILAGRVEDIVEEEGYRPFYMHRTSHWLGKDVHDVGGYREGDASRILEPGMVLTVEPGLYLAEHTDVAPQWQGIGVRIEDDVLVTENGCEVLSDAAPKEIDEIEALRRS